jgi:N-acetylneuraminate synthase
MIEFHLDLDGKGAEYVAGHCWLPEQISRVIQDVRVGEMADGIDDKNPVASELAERQWRADPKDGMRPMQSVRDQWRIR